MAFMAFLPALLEGGGAAAAGAGAAEAGGAALGAGAAGAGAAEGATALGAAGAGAAGATATSQGLLGRTAARLGSHIDERKASNLVRPAMTHSNTNTEKPTGNTEDPAAMGAQFVANANLSSQQFD